LPEAHGDEDVDAKQVPHECPYCYRVFVSGQALGGHKRSHVCSAAAASAFAAPPSPIKNPGMIDLNVEPPSEEVELSTVSDPRFNPGSWSNQRQAIIIHSFSWIPMLDGDSRLSIALGEINPRNQQKKKNREEKIR
jgi:hypothetical protein